MHLELEEEHNISRIPNIDITGAKAMITVARPG